MKVGRPFKAGKQSSLKHLRPSLPGRLNQRDSMCCTDTFIHRYATV
jgi:hypothetical protein